MYRQAACAYIDYADVLIISLIQQLFYSSPITVSRAVSLPGLGRKSDQVLVKQCAA